MTITSKSSRVSKNRNNSAHPLQRLLNYGSQYRILLVGRLSSFSMRLYWFTATLDDH
ncbi:hypothetical protein [Nostoc sp.]|uniref:hypothetical protein n=1 Tax=Nostoc sp. TaxID=1180 RepID=UPI002FF88285